MNVSEILNEAADLIEPDGAWTQGAYARADGFKGSGIGFIRERATCRCAIGALTAATPNALYVVDVEEGLAAKALASVLHIEPEQITRWNDDPARTQAEVVAALREAATPTPEEATK